MKAIQYRAYGGYAENKFVDLPAPACKRRSGTRADAHGRDQSAGITPFAPATTMLPRPRICRGVGGQMGAGVVVETKSPSFSVGDRVFVTGLGFGVIADGAWRELLAAPAAGLMPIPLAYRR